MKKWDESQIPSFTNDAIVGGIVRYMEMRGLPLDIKIIAAAASTVGLGEQPISCAVDWAVERLKRG